QYVLDLYASGEYSKLSKKESKRICGMVTELVMEEETKVLQRKVCEHSLITKLKERDFFCCDLCNATFFNYKQILVHIMSNEHITKASFCC
ncbi:hypothetical protein PFISCL1PPCAC_23354, partial [Pristionchus fissidentatus]